MPLELQIIPASEFIRLGSEGRLDLAASRKLLETLARSCWLRGINQALLDLRGTHPEATPMLTSKELTALVNAFCKMGFSKKLRLAVLYSADPHGGAREFASKTMLRGWNVKATSEFEDALLWLSLVESAEVESGADERQIPIPIEIKETVSKTPPPRTRGQLGKDLPSSRRPRKPSVKKA